MNPLSDTKIIRNAVNKDTGGDDTVKSRSWDDINYAENMLKETINKSKFIETRAKAEARTVVENAKRQGLAEGHQEGFKCGYDEAVRCEIDKKRNIFNAVATCSQQYSDCCRSRAVDSEALEAAFELARKIIEIELEENDDAYFKLYQKAALHISSSPKATLKTGPRGSKAAKAMNGKFEDAIDGLERLEVVLSGEDDGLCILETPFGSVDASVTAQLERAKRIINP
jgi:flagellar biosynthesis/type III secretory pathway protein FliH